MEYIIQVLTSFTDDCDTQISRWMKTAICVQRYNNKATVAYKAMDITFNLFSKRNMTAIQQPITSKTPEIR